MEINIHQGEIDIGLKVEGDSQEICKDKSFKFQITDCGSIHSQNSELFHSETYNLRKRNKTGPEANGDIHLGEIIIKDEPMSDLELDEGQSSISSDFSEEIGNKNLPRKTNRKKGQPKPHLFLCTKCGKTLTGATSFANHTKLVHSKKVINCNQPGCSKVFKNAVNLKTHQDQVHQNKSFPCTFCPVVLKSKDYLRRHLRREHREQKGYNFKCGDSGQSFSTNIYLEKHLKGHEEGLVIGAVSPELSKCPKCEKIISKWKLKDHLETHLEPEVRVRSFKCKVQGCEKAYYNRRDLRVHFELVHEPPREIVCPNCNRAYEKLHQLKRHQIRSCKGLKSK